ncbi:hypothetical protein BD410DRAFT_302867 [Rickenella mellea]|uniref:Uncharacterized protein n=1 Tax=Rickenella mellea TaxID=50990 RepID=A0A4Y7Q260_9AGAM|nr:hypothetical protein BD410DRAFT_302867 [Rickenella mellea]
MYCVTLIEDATAIAKIANIPGASLTLNAGCVVESTTVAFCVDELQDATAATTFTETEPFHLSLSRPAVPTTGSPSQGTSLPAIITAPPGPTTIASGPTTSSSLNKPQPHVGTVLGFAFICIAVGLVS